MAVAGVAYLVLVLLLLSAGSLGIGVAVFVAALCLLPWEAAMAAMRGLARHPWQPVTRLLAGLAYLPGWGVAAAGGILLTLAGGAPMADPLLGWPTLTLGAIAQWWWRFCGVTPHPGLWQLAEWVGWANVLAFLAVAALWGLLLWVNAWEEGLRWLSGRPVPPGVPLAPPEDAPPPARAAAQSGRPPA